MTTVYLVRHSEVIRKQLGMIDSNEDFYTSNKKTVLSVDGERLAERVSLMDEFSNLDVVWSSSFSRAISTAKYFAYRNNLLINITDGFNERRHGIKNLSELPSDFEIHQFNDYDYKIGDGESRRETLERMYGSLMMVMDEYKNKKILIVSHSTSLMYLLGKWCSVSYDGDYKFKDKTFFDGKWKYCQTFKLVFDDDFTLCNVNIVEI